MRVIVITGSTRGLGYGVAGAVLARGCAVTISGRTPAGVDQAVAALSGRYSADRILGQPCDVTDFEQVERLWAAAQVRFGQVNIWINNAGLSHPQLNFWDQTPEQISSVVQTNLLGAMYGSKVALTGLLAQGSGSLYNVEGLGSDGRRVEGLALYGTTKYGLHYLDQALAVETRDTPVLVGTLSPGMVVTDLLIGQYRDRPAEWERAKRIFNILADRVETVAPWLADRVLANTKSGARIKWLTRPKIIGRFLAAPFRKRDLFSQSGP